MIQKNGVRSSHLTIVDLARREKPDPENPERFKEGTKINIFLTCLSTLIREIYGKNNIPPSMYRSNKLTEQLKTSIGLESRTSIICTVSPTKFSETEQTLEFTGNSRIIELKPRRNCITKSVSSLRTVSMKVAKLNKELKRKCGVGLSVYQNMESNLQELDPGFNEGNEESRKLLSDINDLSGCIIRGSSTLKNLETSSNVNSASNIQSLGQNSLRLINTDRFLRVPTSVTGVLLRSERNMTNPHLSNMETDFQLDREATAESIMIPQASNVQNDEDMAEPESANRCIGGFHTTDEPHKTREASLCYRISSIHDDNQLRHFPDNSIHALDNNIEGETKNTESTRGDPQILEKQIRNVKTNIIREVGNLIPLSDNDKRELFTKSIDTLFPYFIKTVLITERSLVHRLEEHRHKLEIKLKKENDLLEESKMFIAILRKDIRTDEQEILILRSRIQAHSKEAGAEKEMDD